MLSQSTWKKGWTIQIIWGKNITYFIYKAHPNMNQNAKSFSSHLLSTFLWNVDTVEESFIDEEENAVTVKGISLQSQHTEQGIIVFGMRNIDSYPHSYHSHLNLIFPIS